MAKGKPKQLLWHRTRGWYVKVGRDNKKFFGGGGAAESSEARRKDPAIRADAESKWHRCEARKDSLTVPVMTAAEAKAELQDYFGDDDVPEALINDRVVEAGRRINPTVAADPIKLRQAIYSLLRVPLPESAICQEVVQTYLDYLKKQPKGQGHYIDAKNRLKHWTKFIDGKTPVSALTREDFKRYRDGLAKQLIAREKWEATQPKPIPMSDVKDDKGNIIRHGKLSAPGISPSTFNKHMVLVKGAFNRWSEETDKTIDDQSRCLSVLHQVVAEKRELVLLSPADVENMLTSFDMKWQAITLLALNGAFSNHDIAFANWNMLRWDTGVIDYTREKNQQTRRIPLWSRTITALAEWKKECPSLHLIFTTTHGQPFISIGKKVKSKKDSLGQQFGNRMKTLKMPYCFGAFRKSAITRAAMGGANELAIKMLLGDAPNDVWRSYGQAVPEIVANAVKSVEAYYFPAPTPTPAPAE